MTPHQIMLAEAAICREKGDEMLENLIALKGAEYTRRCAAAGDLTAVCLAICASGRLSPAEIATLVAALAHLVGEIGDAEFSKNVVMLGNLIATSHTQAALKAAKAGDPS